MRLATLLCLALFSVTAAAQDWSVARSAAPGTQGECTAYANTYPGGYMSVRASAEGSEHQLGFFDERWAFTPGVYINISLEVDGDRLSPGTAMARAATAHRIEIPLEGLDVDKLRKGLDLVLEAEGVSRTVSLRGSMAALERMDRCVAGQERGADRVISGEFIDPEAITLRPERLALSTRMRDSIAQMYESAELGRPDFRVNDPIDPLTTLAWRSDDGVRGFVIEREHPRAITRELFSRAVMERSLTCPDPEIEQERIAHQRGAVWVAHIDCAQGERQFVMLVRSDLRVSSYQIYVLSAQDRENLSVEAAMLKEWFSLAVAAGEAAPVELKPNGISGKNP
ncbi:invasion associated locus B family protein [Thioalkalivibrio thiocyanodenitrificans]|uniref:hypothetical protein n=1 Tax=Thioalkalivibrio thiocyanodenitrificans TaxID=243063 RepID=UPI0003681C5B|nr:hypothetical protein [Thioalkalivibrio thiocyanodenitrificans]